MKSWPTDLIQFNLPLPAPNLRSFRCDLVHKIIVGPYCHIDWDPTNWGENRRAGESTRRPHQSVIDKFNATTRLVPFEAIYNREISSMTVDEPVDLEILSRHLERRQQMGWLDIQIWNLRATSCSALPRFLLQNRNITNLEIRKSAPLEISLGVFLTLDWSVLSRSTSTPHHGLKQLAVRIRFDKPCVSDIDRRLRDILDSEHKSAPFA